MAGSKNHRFGYLSFIVLAVLAVLVTTEPWSGTGNTGRAASLETAPPLIRIEWEGLSDAWPVAGNADTILSYAGFDLAYDEDAGQASWVVYVLTRDELENAAFSRSEDFRPDTNLIRGSALLSDYRGSGYDRGHLAPAGDMGWSEKSMSQSFLLSNMSPQQAGFNRGVWKRLESQVRTWAMERDSLLVITGPLVTPTDHSIGESRIKVPSWYFKVVVDLSPPDHAMLAFLLPHASSKAGLADFAISVDSLESFTGHDFFALAPDQKAIEWLEANSHAYWD